MGPTRPRQHEIDEECRRAFQNFTPSAWVVRPVEDDYGIDREVEIFVDHRATGLIFKVQLKGSDTDDARPRRRVKCDSLSYWKSLPVPVLIVHNSPKADSLYGRWAHSVPPPPREDQKTMIVHFTPEHLLKDNSERLMSDVAVERDASAGRWPRPVPISVTTSGSAGPEQSQLRAYLRAFVTHQGLESLVDIDAISDYAVRVACDWSEVYVRAPVDIASWRASSEAGAAPEGMRLRALAWDIMLCCSMVMLCCKNFDVGLALYDKAAKNAPQGHSWPFMENLVHFLLREQRVGEAVRVLAPLAAHHDPAVRAAAQLLALPVIPHMRHVSIETFDLLVSHLEMSANLDEPTEPAASGTLHYNIANLLQQRNRWTDVSRHLNDALRLYPEYRERAYFYRDRGASSYETQRFGQSAEDYAQAIALGHDRNEVTPLLADALMESGQYRAAHTALQNFEYLGGPLDAFAHLTTMALSAILRVSGLEIQDRSAGDSADGPESSLTHEQAMRIIVDRDALDHVPWMHLALNDDADVASQMLVVAHRLKSFGPAWAHVAFAYWALDDAETVTYAAQYAFRHCGADFLDAVSQAAGDGRDDGQDFLRLVYEIGESSPTPPRPFTFRLNGEVLIQDEE